MEDAGSSACPACGYELGDSGGLCPECGREWSEEDLAAHKAEGGAFARFLAAELAFAGACGAVAALAIAACGVMAREIGVESVVYFTPGAALAFGAFRLRRRVRDRYRRPRWATSLVGQAVGLPLAAIGLVGAGVACLMFVAFWAFFVQGANP